MTFYYNNEKYLIIQYLMSWEVHELAVVREQLIDKDSQLAKRLMREVCHTADQIVSALTIWQKEIRDPQQLKALVEWVRLILLETVSVKMYEVERERGLGAIDLFDREDDE